MTSYPNGPGGGEPHHAGEPQYPSAPFGQHAPAYPPPPAAATFPPATAEFRPPPDTGYAPPPPTTPPPGFTGNPGVPPGFGPAPAGFVPLTSVPGAVPPARRRRGGLIAGIAMAVVVLGGAAAAAVIAGGDDGNGSSSRPAGTAHRSLSLPSSFGDFTRSTDATSRQLAEDMRGQMTSASSAEAALYQHALIGIYQSSMSGTRVIFVGISADDAPAEWGSLSDNTATAVDGVMVGAGVSDAASFGAGPLGGDMRCGKAHGATPVCAWADASSLGMVLEAPGTTAQTAVTTRALRAAAEH